MILLVTFCRSTEKHQLIESKFLECIHTNIQLINFIVSCAHKNVFAQFTAS